MGDHKPNKCYYKPNRSKARVFTEADAARIFCQAKADSGATEVGFIRRCKCWDSETSECEDLKKAVEIALLILAGIIATISLPEGFLASALIAVARWLPVSLVERMGITKLLTELPTAAADLERVLVMLRSGLRVGPP